MLRGGFLVSDYELGLWLTCRSMLQSLDLSVSGPKRCLKRARSPSVLSQDSEARGTQVGAESQEILTPIVNWLETSWAAGLKSLDFWDELEQSCLSVTVAPPGTFFDMNYCFSRSCFRGILPHPASLHMQSNALSMNKNYLSRSSPGWRLVQNK